MMARNLVTSLSYLKSNIFSYARLATHVRYFHSFQCPSLRLRHNKNSVSKLKPTSSKSRITSYFTGIRKAHSDSYQAINTNISNNLLLWKYENMKYFRNLKIYVIGQSLVFMVLGYNMYHFLPSSDNYESYKDYLMDNPILSTAMMLPAAMVIGSFLVMWFFETRSLKYIILNKGGKMVTLVSFHPTKGTKSVVVPANEISVGKSRAEPGAYMSLKVQTKKLYYLIDKEGIFVNPQMFDVVLAAK